MGHVWKLYWRSIGRRLSIYREATDHRVEHLLNMYCNSIANLSETDWISNENLPSIYTDRASIEHIWNTSVEQQSNITVNIDKIVIEHLSQIDREHQPNTYRTFTEHGPSWTRELTNTHRRIDPRFGLFLSFFEFHGLFQKFSFITTDARYIKCDAFAIVRHMQQHASQR